MASILYRQRCAWEKIEHPRARHVQTGEFAHMKDKQYLHGLLSLYNTITCNVSFKRKLFYTSLAVQEGHKIAIICIYTHFKEYFYLSYKEELSSSSQDMILQHKAVDRVIFESTAELMLPEQSQNYQISLSVFSECVLVCISIVDGHKGSRN